MFYLFAALIIKTQATLSYFRNYDQNSYVVIQSDSSDIHQIAIESHGKIIKQMEMLQDHYILEIPKTALSKRSSHPKAQFWEEQVHYRHLHKRDTESKEMKAIRNSLNLTDPGFGNQWHLYNEETPHFDLNLTSVWTQNITGWGVTVAFIDDGIAHDNPDLKDNFSLEGSWDYNEHKQLPTPFLNDDTHGTRCAGEVGAVKNDVCGVGVAYTSKVAGIRILSGSLTNEDEAAAVTFACNTTQIYSCSWGPRDDGRTMEIPPEIVRKSFDAGIKYCRNGLGALYVFAAGNGGNSGDNCNFDGYTNSIYTITVAAMDNQQNHPWYSERCSAILISAYSSKGAGMGGIYTTDWKDGCSNRHGGTSAAAPLASGVYALLLQIRPDLNWRDVQRLTIENAVIVNPKDDDWHTNSVGRAYNHKYGYGTFDTWKLIESAKTYKNVGDQTKIVIDSIEIKKSIPAKNSSGISDTITITMEDIKKAGLARLEHVEVHVFITHEYRGDVAISLTSPSYFKSQLIEAREHDAASSGFPGWRMMTVAHWDENAAGNWTLNVVDNFREDKKGVLEKWRLTLWGDTKADAEESGKSVILTAATEASAPASSISKNSTDSGNVEEPGKAVVPPATTEASVPTSSISKNSTDPGNISESAGSIVKHFSSDNGSLLFVSFLGILLLALYFAWKRGLFKPPQVKIPKEVDLELEMLDRGDLHEGDNETVNEWNQEDFDNLVFDADEYV